MSLTDTLGSLAVASKGHFMTGVSTDIGTSFTKPAGRVGDTLFGKAIVTAMGKSLAYTRVDFMDGEGTLVAHGRTFPLYNESQILKLYTDHTKYIGRSSNHKVRPALSFIPPPFSLSHSRTMWSLLRMERVSLKGSPLKFPQPSFTTA